MTANRGGKGGLALIVLFMTTSAWAAKPKSETLVVELPVPYEELLRAVNEVAASGTIAGSTEYEKDTSISGARATNPGQAFGAWTGPGQAVYKARTGVLSPAHFLASNDSGTITVRYVVQSVTANSTRVMIDAVFVEETHRHRHPSDGAVEAAELGQLQQKLRAFEQQKIEARRRAEAEELEQLQQTAEDEKKQLDVANAELSQLEQHAQELRRQATGRVKVAAALKTAPNSRAASLGPLATGDTVRVLATTDHWCKVRDAQGHEGWVAYASLEALP